MNLANRYACAVGLFGLGAALVGCSAIAESAPLQDAKNQAVCSAASQPLQLLQENVAKLDSGTASQAAGNAIDSTESALKTASQTATGQVATALLGLDSSVTDLINAWTSGAVGSELAPLVAAVETQAAEVQTACAQ